MTRSVPAARASGVALAICLSIALLLFWIWYPGRLGPDSTEQLHQAVSGRLTDWHPPVMAALWRLLGAAALGPVPMLALQVGFYWLGIWCIFDASAHLSGARRAIIAIAAAFHPLILVLLGAVLKDVQMASALLAAFGLLYRDREKFDRIRPVAATIAAILLCYAALVRHNGLAAVSPILVYWLWPSSLSADRTLPIAAAVLVIGVPASQFVNHRLLDAAPTNVEGSLQLFDIAGIAHFSHEPAALPITAGCYTPFYWDRLDSPRCGALFQRFAAPVAQQRPALTRIWLGAIADHWPAYAEHRISHFNSSVYFLVPADVRCRSAPEYNRCDEPPRVRAENDFIRKNPLYWPCIWLAAGIWLLLQATASRPARALAWSGVLYGTSFLFVGVATDYQYHLWTMLAIGLALGIHFSRQRDWVAPLRQLAAPVGMIVAAGYIARLAL
ncbi:MAG TPA: hypothetical protein VFW35_12125 [Sphingomicrobium sp.]|nr:hypothetical protein [Sphingomicrobium sp.]